MASSLHWLQARWNSGRIQASCTMAPEQAVSSAKGGTSNCPWRTLAGPGRAVSPVRVSQAMLVLTMKTGDTEHHCPVITTNLPLYCGHIDVAY